MTELLVINFQIVYYSLCAYAAAGLWLSISAVLIAALINRGPLEFHS